MNMSKLIIKDPRVACSADIARLYGIEPDYDYVDRYAHEYHYGSLFVDDEIVESQPSHTLKVIAAIDDLEFYCKSGAAEYLGITKATLTRKT